MLIFFKKYIYVALYSIFVFNAILTTSSAEEVYKWVDSNGITHYGDKSKEAKQNGAKTIDISTPSHIGSVQVKTDNYVPKPQQIRQDPNNENINYKISIVTPTENEGVRANNGEIKVSTLIRPNPHSEYSVKYFLDGSLYASSHNSNKIILNTVSRGEHTLQVKLQTKNGKIFASKPIKFFVQKVSAIKGK